MSITKGKCPACLTDVTLTSENGINCPQCGTKITYENIKLSPKSLNADTIADLIKLQKRADESFNKEDYETAYKLYVQISEYMPGDVRIYFKKELVRLFLLRTTESSYASNDVFFDNIQKIGDKLNCNPATDLKNYALKVMICENIYKFLVLMFSEEKNSLRTKHSKNNLCKMLSNISKLTNYAYITCGIITMDEISNDKHSAIIALKTVRLGIEMCKYTLSTFNYIGEPEMISTSDPTAPVRYVRRSYTLMLEPEDQTLVSEMLERFNKLKKALLDRSDKYILDEIQRSDDLMRKKRIEQENEKRAKQQQENDWIEKNQSLLTKNENECKICKLLSKVFLGAFGFFFIFSAFVWLIIQIPNSFLPIITLLFGIAGVIYYLLAKIKTKNIKFYQSVLEKKFNLKN